MQTRTRLLAFTLVCLLCCNACGSALYFKQSRVTRRAFQNAQSSGAKIISPYEYYGAQARIEEAEHLASIAEYDLAIRWLEEAQLLSEQASDNVQSAQAEADE